MEKKNNIQRILAVCTLFLLAVCFILTLIFAFTGNKYFMPMMLITMMVPILLWICMFFYKQSKDRRKDS